MVQNMLGGRNDLRRCFTGLRSRFQFSHKFRFRCLQLLNFLGQNSIALGKMQNTSYFRFVYNMEIFQIEIYAAK